MFAAYDFGEQNRVIALVMDSKGRRGCRMYPEARVARVEASKRYDT